MGISNSYSYTPLHAAKWVSMCQPLSRHEVSHIGKCLTVMRGHTTTARDLMRESGLNTKLLLHAHGIAQIAMTMLASMGRPIIHINDIFVLKKYRRRGIATHMIHDIINRYNVENIVVDCAANNINAIHMFIKCGFVIDAALSDDQYKVLTRVPDD